MSETKAVIGLSWEPKLPTSSSSTATRTKSGTSSNTMTNRNQPEGCAIWKPSSELVDGLFLAPNNPKNLNKLLRKQLKDTSGNRCFDMPSPTITPELQKDLQLLKVGTVMESSLDFFSSRLKNKERKATLVDELLSDHTLGDYRKRKVRDIEEKSRPGGNEKWKIKGKYSNKRAKQTRQ
ncbi:hypothetical protein FNV43_RR01107 [Rhamnella rubrinervis]|uniref:Fcf2 pre-rRNA processing C-terminal domain-containing protein n=1 Tax=Rhamnella rubrinervis TaxID=2594499 RepID=A0A8K0MRZ7_9ROSA|nr:hypothetical protein FNV43_RR01107 [Rhamnella rubrinervis]